MASLKEIRSRVSSVTNTQKITKAMKLVAAAKLRRAQESAEAARPYSERLQSVIGTLAASVDPAQNPLFRKEDDAKHTLIVLMSSDRGLCGGFNHSLFRAVKRFLAENQDQLGHVYFAPIGRKGEAFMRRHPDLRRVRTSDWAPKASGATIGLAREIVEPSIDEFVAGRFDRVYLAYNRFESALTQTPAVEQLLPLDPSALVTQDAEAAATDTQGETSGPDFIYEPSREALLETLLPQYLNTRTYGALLESEASEFGARMTAMDNATTNASDLIDSLTLQMNRARQAMITTELSEITAGAEALKG